MEQVLFRLHVRLILTSNLILGHKARRILESVVLLTGITSLVVLCSLHVSYVGLSQRSCLPKMLHENESCMVNNSCDFIEINIAPPTFDSKNNNAQFHTYVFSKARGVLMLQSEAKEQFRFSSHIVDLTSNDECLGHPVFGYLLQNWIGFDVVMLNWASLWFNGSGFLLNTKTKEMFNLNFASDFISKKGVSLVVSNNHLHVNGDNLDDDGWMDVFSSHRDWEIVVGFVDSKCFTSNLMHPQSFLCRWWTSTDTWVLSNGIQQFVLFRCGVLASSLFLFVIMTTLVSYTLRETQERMLKFTYLLQFHVTRRLAISSLVLTHVLDSLVFVPIMLGIYFFLFEFFSDQLVSSFLV